MCTLKIIGTHAFNGHGWVAGCSRHRTLYPGKWKKLVPLDQMMCRLARWRLATDLEPSTAEFHQYFTFLLNHSADPFCNYRTVV